MSLVSLSIRKKLLYAYGPLIMVFYYLAMHGINLYSYVIIPYLFILTLASLSILFEGNNIRKNALFVIFLIYSIISVLQYSYNGRPLTCYTTALRYIVFPMIFYIFGQDDKDDTHEFYRFLLYSCFFCFVIGLYLYVVGPDYYKTFLMNAREKVWYSAGFMYEEDEVLNYSRMSSFFGFSYDVCFFSIPALIISLMFTLNKEEKVKKWILYLFAIVSLTSAILCFQRLSMAFGVLFVVFYVGYSYVRGNKFGSRLFLALVLVVVFVFLLFFSTERGAVIYELLMNRFENFSFSDAMSERTHVSVKALRAWDFYIFGGGIGSFSHVAMRLGFPSVSDAEFVRILTEYGLFGSLIFATLFGSNLIWGIKNFKIFGIEVCILLFYLIACTGSNALSMSYVFSPIFWYALGHIQNKSYKHRYICEHNEMKRMSLKTRNQINN